VNGLLHVIGNEGGFDNSTKRQDTVVGRLVRQRRGRAGRGHRQANAALMAAAGASSVTICSLLPGFLPESGAAGCPCIPCGW
jgi:hypothetical protein